MIARQTSRTSRMLVAAAVVAAAASAPSAQQIPAAPNMNDPRVGLKAGLFDAGEAAKNLEHVATLPKPDGFFDPNPQPRPNRPEPPPPGAPPAGPPPFDPVASNRLGYTNSDLAFQGNHVIVGNYHGFNTYDVERPNRPKLIASVVCPGGQGDVSIHGKLLFMSVEQTRGRLDCGTQGVMTAVSGERFRGIRIFDISDINKPKQVAAIQTCRGSHTHTLVPDPSDPGMLYVYGSGTSTVRSSDELAGCSGLRPDEDPNTALFSIDVIQVPLSAPQNAKIVNRPRIFADEKTGAIAGLWRGGSHGEGTQTTRETSQCHDITVFPEVGLAAGACSGNGILLDIHDPKNPKRLDQVVDKGFSFWHSATFNNEGTKVVFTDEWGGGGRPRCLATDPPTWGADALFDIVDTPEGKRLKFGSYFKMPAPQTEQENCVAHNGSLIPVPGRDIMVQAWYQGGISIFDFTDTTRPVEIAFFDRGPIDGKELRGGGFWSAYWYNGSIYGSELTRGIDVFRLKPSEYVSQNELDAALLIRDDELNTQEQKKIAWPAASAVSLAYVDQLTRSGGIQAARAAAVKSALGRADGRQKDTKAVAAELHALATQIGRDASGATPADAKRLTSLAGSLDRRADMLK